MTTETTSRPMSRFAEKLSAFRAGLNKDEQDLLDEIVGSEVEAHAKQLPKAAAMKDEGDDVEAHAAAWPGGWGKAPVEKEGDDVEAHAMPRDKFAPKTSEGDDVEAHARQLPKAPINMGEGDDVESHARQLPKVAERMSRPAFKFNPAKASYEIGSGEEGDVEAHARQLPRPVEARMPAVTR